MKRAIYSALILSFLIFVNSGFGFDKVGTTAAQFLQIGIGAKLSGMGSAGIAIIEGPEALYWNPGRIAQNRQFAVSAYYADWIADLRHQFIGVTVPVGYSGTFGLSAITLGGDEFEQTTLTYQEGNNVMVEYLDMAIGASYAHSLTDYFSIGGTLKYIRQKLFHETASTIAVDVGTSLRTDLPGFSIGMAMTNLGGEMELDGRDIITSEPDEPATEYQVSSWPLPLTFQVGFGWHLWGKNDALSESQNNDSIIAFDARHINEGFTHWRLGYQYAFKQMLFLRTGYVFGHDTERWSFGTGLSIPVSEFHITVDFAYADLGDLDAVQRISLQISGY